MIYQISKNIDGDRMFIVNFSELNGRLDPSIYQPHFKFVSKKYTNVKLSEIALIDPPCNFEKKGEVSFIPMDAIDATNGVITYQGTKKTEDTKGYTRFQEGDLLWAKITPCMQNGKSAIARNLINGFGCGSTEFFVIRPKNMDVVCVEYLFFLLRDERILRSAMNYFGGSAGQQRVSPIFLKNFNVPLPCLDVQMDVVRLFMKASTEKRLKEQQAETLLQSIDEYLLSELRINRVTDTRTENGRFFYTSFHNIMGEELAPLSVKNKGKQSKSILYKETKLSTIATIEKGQAITSKDIISGDYPVIAGGQSSPYNHNQYNYKGNVVTVSASGAYSGYVWYHDYPIFASDCSVIYSKDEKVYLTKYIYEILHLRQQEIYLLQKGAGQPHVYASDLAQMTIPIVPFEKQREIISHCNKLRATAEKLKQEGMNLVESARKAIETMILGK